MTTDAFTEAARAEAERQNPVPPTYDPKGPSQWERLLAQQAFRNGAEWARDHLAQQEPTDADLTELLWKTVVEVCDTHPEVFNDAPTDEVAAAVLPILRRAQADAWDEGAQAQADTYGGQIDTGPNPYRTEQTNG